MAALLKRSRITANKKMVSCLDFLLGAVYSLLFAAKAVVRFTGHRTEAVCRRYDIVSDRDLKQAATKLENYIGEQRAEKPNGHKTGTAEPQEWIPEPLPDCKLLNYLVSRAGLEV